MMLKKLAAVPNVLVVIGVPLALVTVTYAQSLEKGLESKPYAEGEGAQGAGSSVKADSGEKGWVEETAGAGGAFRATGTPSQEAPALAPGEDKPYPEGEAGRAGSSVAGMHAQDRGWPEGGAGTGGAARLEGVSLQEWLDITADGDQPVLYAFSGVTAMASRGLPAAGRQPRSTVPTSTSRIPRSRCRSTNGTAPTSTRAR